MRILLRPRFASTLLSIMVFACGGSRADYVGNWHAPGASLKITRSGFLWFRMIGIGPDNEIRGPISKWEGAAPVVDEAENSWLFAVAEESVVDIQEVPQHSGEDWSLRVGGLTLERIPNHELAHPLFPDAFPGHPAVQEELSTILDVGKVPASHHSMVGHWRGLSLDIIVAHDGQVRAEIITSSEVEVVDGVVEQWKTDEIEIRTHDGSTDIEIDEMPRQSDGQWRMRLNGEETVRVHDHMPVGARGEWTTPSRIPSWGGIETLLQYRCGKGYYNACILLSRRFDTEWEAAHAMVTGPAEIGETVYCCDRCRVEQSFVPHRCEGCAPLMADGTCEGHTSISCTGLDVDWSRETEALKCSVPAGGDSGR